MYSTERLKILCVTDFYVPGFKGGGLIRTLVNMCVSLRDDIEFFVFTRDRDLGDSESYSSIQVNDWNSVERVNVYYASPENYGVRGFKKVLGHCDFDVIYLNSFFSIHGSVLLLLYLKLYSKCRKPILIAPRGEFSPGALQIKPSKKRLYLALVRLFGLYNNVYWHASTTIEARDIIRVFPNVSEKLFIAIDPVSKKNLSFFSPTPVNNKSSSLSVVFISRISRIKNLHWLLRVLFDVNSVVSLSIYGPIEDVEYWRECQVLIDRLPSNISVTYLGSIEPDNVTATFANYDLFVFPTLGENYGHVIFESLSVGTPVVVSDQTPWKSDSDGAITILSLDSIDKWKYAIENAASKSYVEREQDRFAAFNYANAVLDADDSHINNVRMFQSLVRTSNKTTFQ